MRRRQGAEGDTSQPKPPTAAQPPNDLPSAAPAEAPTAVEQALRDLGVYPSVARHYRDFTPALVARAVTIAQRLPGRSSLPATLAQLLREELISPGWLRQERPDLFLGPMRDEVADSAPAACALGADEEADPRARIYARLCAILESDIHLFIAPEHITLDGETLIVTPPTWFSTDERAALDDAVCDVAAEVGLRPVAWTPPSKSKARPVPPTPATEPARVERPDWIGAAQWGQLHLIARSAFAGSRWEGGEIIGVSPGLTRMLRTQLAGLAARLRPPAHSERVTFLSP